MAGLLVALGVVSMACSVALPLWTTTAIREREAELVFRGEQYARAIRLYQQRHAGTLPRSVDVLLEQRYLRRRYLDPITNADFQLLYADAEHSSATSTASFVRDASEGYGGIVGVVSSSPRQSLRRYRGRNRYSEWLFIAASAEPRSR
jgi:type II secretory pathway pseudopilin PulG